ncbi:TPA: restriction endonuclease subunit S [Streptococcus suis]|uniref:restriction endonuclease subunit S n=3 Tax=Streptococcus suis TaxID=1307 RepID=UPI000CF5A15F|nr:restriction endonuclease subunit S [Streptococcus suis]MDY7593776.1 restriction endonuclease subunit S [Streptococcus suis]MDY7596971.1 restriction endonuclease subunit S [Streptococcus suis]NQL69204.1 restriction endonuclease subunit S [Streptococcus suis]RRR50095.1 restriction endonuclease subunit S [Streptococcus suis]WNF69629.1 restriction endonuclease subunit S [Streptococcus suis]
MTRMKDSGIEWIGEVPEEWGIVRLKDCLEINNGKGYKDIETDETGYPVIGSGGQFAYARKYLHDGTAILLGRKGTIDKPLYIEGKFWTVDTMFYGVPKSGIHAKFIYYVALQIPFGLYSTNTALPSMTQTDLQNHHFVMPPLDEQTQIADFLDKKVAQLDKVKSLLEEQIKTLEDYRQSLIYETVTKGLDKTVPLKDSGVDWIGQIPEGWGVGKLSQFFGEVKKKNIRNFEKNLLSLSYGRVIRKSIDNLMGLLPESFDTYNIIDENDIVFRLTDLQNDKKSLRTGLSKERGIITSAYVTIRTINNFINANYYNHLFYAYDLCKVYYNFGGGVRQGGTWGDLSVLQILIPSVTEQIQIADFLDKKTEQINQMIAIKKEQIENINKQRQTLIYDYVTGKRRV